MGKPKLYLDTCCLSRLYDAPTDDRVAIEAQSVRLLLRRILRKEALWIASEALWIEVAQIRKKRAREALFSLLSRANEVQSITPVDLVRAFALQKMSLGTLDSLHLAIAERCGCDSLLTTDDRFIKRVQRQHDKIRTRVQNPLSWIAERLTNENS
jgi:predicted nucleic acid-binding protein